MLVSASGSMEQEPKSSNKFHRCLNARVKPIDSASTDGGSQCSSTVILSSQLMGVFLIYIGIVANLEDKIPFGGASILVYLCSLSSPQDDQGLPVLFFSYSRTLYEVFLSLTHPKKERKEKSNLQTIIILSFLRV